MMTGHSPVSSTIDRVMLAGVGHPPVGGVFGRAATLVIAPVVTSSASRFGVSRVFSGGSALRPTRRGGRWRAWCCRGRVPASGARALSAGLLRGRDETLLQGRRRRIEEVAVGGACGRKAGSDVSVEGGARSGRVWRSVAVAPGAPLQLRLLEPDGASAHR